MICICVLEDIFMKYKTLLLALPLLGLVGCKDGNSDKNAVYASAYPVYDLVKRVAGDKLTVRNLIPAGMEPHHFEPTTKQIASLTDSRAIFVNGLGFEHWTEHMTENLAEKTYTVTDGIEARTVDGIVDPHMWLDPTKAILEMKNISDSLSKIDPDNAEVYSNNYAEEAAKFTVLDGEYAASTATFTQKKIVVTHAAFGYLCDRYGLEQIYVSGLEPEDEPSAKEMEAIIQQIKDAGVKTVFAEELLPTDIAQTIATETGANIEILNPMGGLSEEELKTEDYLSVMRENLEKLEKACK